MGAIYLSKADVVSLLGSYPARWDRVGSSGKDRFPFHLIDVSDDLPRVCTYLKTTENQLTLNGVEPVDKLRSFGIYGKDKVLPVPLAVLVVGIKELKVSAWIYRNGYKTGYRHWLKVEV